MQVALWLSLACLLPARAQIGSDCSDSVPCAGNQQACSLGYCRCTQGFVKHVVNGQCVPERGFNETCDFDDQCVDFRLKCSESRCACVKYFHWDEYSRQCVTFKDLKYMLTDMEEKHHSHGRLMSETNKVFMGMMWTGLSVLLVGLVLASGCLIYGCCWGRPCCCPQDTLSKSRLTPGLRREPTRGTAETTVPRSSNTQDRLQRGTQGTGIDYIPALYETTSFDLV